jgi:hypothetical protein
VLLRTRRFLGIKTCEPPEELGGGYKLAFLIFMLFSFSVLLIVLFESGCVGSHK